MIDLPAIRERAAAFEAARSLARANPEGRDDGATNWFRFVAESYNTTLAADVRGLCAEIERLKQLLGERQ